jgi:hypothetical protein
MSNEIPKATLDKLSAMRARMTEGYIGEAKCGCVFAVYLFDPTSKKDTKAAMKEAGEWVKSGLIPKRVPAEETKKIAHTCPHREPQP